MKKTIKLYDADSHMKNFSAVVVSCGKTEDGRYDVVLDRTAFFPESGGQNADKGRIGDFKVGDVQINDGVIHHFTDVPLDLGREYGCEIDFETRFRRMQNHTGEHIISGIIHKLFGYDNVGFHMGEDFVTADFNGVLTEADVKKVELLANRAVYENVPVKAEYPAPEKLASMEYRSKLDLTEDVRIVTIEGYDACACCAPHVSRTGEIGIIKLYEFVGNKGGTRINMLCGFDALEDYERRYDLIHGISKELSIKQSDIGRAFERLKTEIAELKQKNYELRTELFEYKISGLTYRDGNLIFFEEELSRADIRKLMNRGLEYCGGICAVFSGNDDSGYNFCASSKRGGMKTVSENMREKLGAKCGGSDEMIQGSVGKTKDEIKIFLK